MTLCLSILVPSPFSLLHAQTADIVKALHKQLKDKSVKTRQVSFLCTVKVCVAYTDTICQIL